MTSTSRTTRRVRAVAAAGAALAAVGGLPALASSASHHAAALPSLASVPSWARGAHPAAAEPGGSRVDVALALAGRDTAGLQALDAAVSNPDSPDYRHFISSQTYAERFAPSVSEAAAVRSWLAGQGLTVDATTPNRTLVEAHGTATTVAHAFSTSFARFRVDGALRRAPLREPTLPAAIQRDVAAVSGLTEVDMTPTAGPAPAFFNARPCSKYYGQKTAGPQPKYHGHHQKDAICGYTPSQIRSAYRITATHLRGQGVTVGIVDSYASPTIVADANTYSKRHGLPTLKAGQLVQHTDGDLTNPPEVDPGGLGVSDPQGWAGEETLDVEAVHTVAPHAGIDYFAALTPVGPGLYVALDNAVESGKVQVVSNSYGSSGDADPSDKSEVDMITNEAAAEGVTIDFSSGDDGDETDPSADGARTADFPATSTGVTAVGGTTLEVNKQGHRAAETYWGVYRDTKSHGKWDLSTKALYGAGGGGVSTSYAEPSWQRGVVPSNLATYGGVPAGRVEPDVSMVADSTTGFLMGQTMTPKSGPAHYSEYRIGGTSLSCPLFSGLVALAAEKNHHKGIGLITPTLYKDSRTAAGREKLFHDPSGVATAHGQSVLANVRPDYTDTTDTHSAVTDSLRTLGNLETLHAYKGYDDSTGLGTPKAKALVAALG
jgi:subtilase family serine protease